MCYYFSHNWHHMVINGSLIGVYLDGSWLAVVTGFYLELTFTNRLMMLTNGFYINCSFLLLHFFCIFSSIASYGYSYLRIYHWTAYLEGPAWMVMGAGFQQSPLSTCLYKLGVKKKQIFPQMT